LKIFSVIGMDKTNNVVMMKFLMLLLEIHVPDVANVSKVLIQLYMFVVQILNVLVLHSLHLLLVASNIKQDTNSNIFLLELVKSHIIDIKAHIREKN